MKKPQTILTLTEIVSGIIEYSSTEIYESPAEAKRSILSYIENEGKELHNEPRLTSGRLDDLFSTNQTKGTISYEVGEHEYLFTWCKTPGEYNVTNEELVSVLEAFCNTSRTLSDFEYVATLISQKMHRYCQNELWKFVKAIIRVFANANFDKRNKVAHDQAWDIMEYMENNNI